MTVSLIKRTATQLAREILANLDEHYTLVYVEYRDELSDDQKAALVAGDMEGVFCDPFFEEWENNAQYESVKTIIVEAAQQIIRDWENEDLDDHSTAYFELEGSPELWERLEDEIRERDDSDHITQLVNQSGATLLRINVLDEDHAFSFRDVAPEEVLEAVGLEATAQNLHEMRDTLAECSPEFSVLLGYWIVGAELSDLYALPYNCREVVIENPYLYLGNPFAGSGYISDNPFFGDVRVLREDLRTDKAAFGYSVNEVFGGLHAGQFECKIRPLVNLSKEKA